MDDVTIGNGPRGITQIADALEALHPLIHAVEVGLSGLGVPVAPLYLASARGSLHHAARYISRHCSTYGRQAGEEIVEGSGISLQSCAKRHWVGVRHQQVGSTLVEDPVAELPPRAASPNLASALIRSNAADELCAGPVGAMLLADALADERWLHLASGTKWSTDAAGARVLVSAISGGRSFPGRPAGIRHRMIDREVLSLLTSLGWSRLVSPEIPTNA